MQQNSYQKFTVTFNEYFREVVNQFPQEPKNLYEPLRYFLSLGGKRVRPLLVLLAADFFDADVTKALPAATSVELFHNFSLIHDDIMDNAPLRRNKQTVHEKWNRSVAILSGDALFVKAYQALAKSNPEIAASLEAVFSKMALEVCEGQQLDMDFENLKEVSIEQYINMIRLKTAVLLGCSLQMGAICANASAKDAELIYQAGEKLGIAFQLTDDYLDVFGNPEQVGKQVGGDIISNKKTWLLIKSLELAKGEEQKALQQFISEKNFDPQKKVTSVKNIFTSQNLHNFIKNEIGNYYQEAVMLLQSTSASKEKLSVFVRFAQDLMHRTK